MEIARKVKTIKATTDIAKNISQVADSTNNVASQGEKIVNSISELNSLSDQLDNIVTLFKLG